MQLGESGQFIWLEKMSDSDRTLDQTLGSQRPVNIREHPERDFADWTCSVGVDRTQDKVRSVSMDTSDTATITTDLSIRSPWLARLVTLKFAELASNHYVLNEGV
jgi:hypothetical protein